MLSKAKSSDKPHTLKALKANGEAMGSNDADYNPSEIHELRRGRKRVNGKRTLRKKSSANSHDDCIVEPSRTTPRLSRSGRTLKIATPLGLVHTQLYIPIYNIRGELTGMHTPKGTQRFSTNEECQIGLAEMQAVREKQVTQFFISSALQLQSRKRHDAVCQTPTSSKRNSKQRKRPQVTRHGIIVAPTKLEKKHRAAHSSVAGTSALQVDSTRPDAAVADPFEFNPHADDEIARAKIAAAQGLRSVRVILHRLKSHVGEGDVVQAVVSESEACADLSLQSGPSIQPRTYAAAGFFDRTVDGDRVTFGDTTTSSSRPCLPSFSLSTATVVSANGLISRRPVFVRTAKKPSTLDLDRAGLNVSAVSQALRCTVVADAEPGHTPVTDRRRSARQPMPAACRIGSVPLSEVWPIPLRRQRTGAQGDPYQSGHKPQLLPRDVSEDNADNAVLWPLEKRRLTQNAHTPTHDDNPSSVNELPEHVKWSENETDRLTKALKALRPYQFSDWEKIATSVDSTRKFSAHECWKYATKILQYRHSETSPIAFEDYELGLDFPSPSSSSDPPEETVKLSTRTTDYSLLRNSDTHTSDLYRGALISQHMAPEMCREMSRRTNNESLYRVRLHGSLIQSSSRLDDCMKIYEEQLNAHAMFERSQLLQDSASMNSTTN